MHDTLAPTPRSVTVITNQWHYCRLCSLSHVRLFVTLRIVAHQPPLSMGILQARILEGAASRFSSGSSQPRDQIKPRSPTVQADSLPTEPSEKPENRDWTTIPTQLTHQMKSIHHARPYSATNSDQRPKEEFAGKTAK